MQYSEKLRDSRVSQTDRAGILYLAVGGTLLLLCIAVIFGVMLWFKIINANSTALCLKQARTTVQIALCTDAMPSNYNEDKARLFDAIQKDQAAGH